MTDYGKPQLMAEELGWPEGPTLQQDGSVVFVESYRSQLSVFRDGKVSRLAYTAGAPNSCVVGAKGELYVCQNGGTVGPWRAAEMSVPSIQRVEPGGKAVILVTEVEGIKLNGPNDLVFGADGHLYFTDPGTYNPANPDPSYIFAIAPDGTPRVVVAFEKPVFPNGLAVEADGSVVWDESYTGHVRRRRPNGRIEDLGKMPGANPILDGMKIGADGRLYVTDLVGKGIHVVQPNGKVDAFIEVGGAPTNCIFSGETLWVTDATVLAASDKPNLGGQLWKLTVPGGGAPTAAGSIAGGR
jgi:gluconolactonase